MKKEEMFTILIKKKHNAEMPEKVREILSCRTVTFLDENAAVVTGSASSDLLVDFINDPYHDVKISWLITLEVEVRKVNKLKIGEESRVLNYLK